MNDQASLSIDAEKSSPSKTRVPLIYRQHGRLVFALLVLVATIVATFVADGISVSFSSAIAAALPATGFGVFLAKLLFQNRSKTLVGVVSIALLNAAGALFGAGFNGKGPAVVAWAIVGFALTISSIVFAIRKRLFASDTNKMVRAVQSPATKFGNITEDAQGDVKKVSLDTSNASASSTAKIVRWSLAITIAVALGFVVYRIYPSIREKVLLYRSAKGDVSSTIKLADLYQAEALDYCLDNDKVRARQLVAQSLSLVQGPANQGNVDAMFKLGYYYVIPMCETVPGQHDLGVEWLEKAAKGGNVRAMNQLLGVYFEPTSDEDKAAEGQRKGSVWLLKLAEIGDLSDQRAAGYRYMNGIGLPQDYEKAAYWFRKASDQGDQEAAERLKELPSLIAQAPRYTQPAKLGEFTVLSDATAAKAMGFTDCTADEVEQLLHCALVDPARYSLFGVTVQSAKLSLANEDMRQFGFDTGKEQRKPLQGVALKDLHYGVVDVTFPPEKYDAACSKANQKMTWGRPLSCAIKGTAAEVLASMAKEGWVLIDPEDREADAVHQWDHEGERVTILRGADDRFTLAVGLPEEISKQIAEARALGPTVDELVDQMKH